MHDLLEHSGLPMLMLDGNRIIVANAAAREAIGAHILGQDARVAFRHPAAVDLLSRTGYRELRDHGIHVVNVKPALTDTAFSATARGVQRRMGGDPPEKVARWVAEALESGSTNTGYR